MKVSLSNSQQYHPNSSCLSEPHPLQVAGLCASGHPHITISTNSKLNAKPAETFELLQSEEGGKSEGTEGGGGRVETQGITVYGVVGLQAMVVHPTTPSSGDSGGNGDGGSGGRSVDPLLRLPKGIAKKLREFMESADPGQRLKVSPTAHHPSLVNYYPSTYTHHTLSSPTLPISSSLAS